MIETPCQLWPNHPLPVWLQTPGVIIMMILIGVCFGVQLGMMWRSGIDKLFDWMFKKLVKDSESNRIP